MHPLLQLRNKYLPDIFTTMDWTFVFFIRLYSLYPHPHMPLPKPQGVQVRSTELGAQALQCTGGHLHRDLKLLGGGAFFCLPAVLEEPQKHPWTRLDQEEVLGGQACRNGVQGLPTVGVRSVQTAQEASWGKPSSASHVSRRQRRVSSAQG